jgi:TonB-dependent starch-binding outer membrane protein SusC
MRHRLSILSVLLFLSVAMNAQNITMTGEKITLRAALGLIEQQSGKHFAYNEGVLNLSVMVSTPNRTVSLENALNEILRQAGAVYTIEDDLIIVKKDTSKALLVYQGTVTDDHNDPLPGVYVYLEDSATGSVTDENGHFQIDAYKGATLVFTALGFKTENVVLNGQTKLNITLSSDNLFLEDAVVIGYGSVKRKDLTTAVSVVSTKDLDTRPIISAGSALQGKAAGVQVIQPSGMPGTSLSIRVRGATSVQASNEPLYVVDGIPTDDISNIAADDIASLQVLKDASSSAIYGARAANGVVLITTKRGDANRTELRFSSFVGFSKLGNKIEALNTEEYKDLMKELAAKTVTVPTIPDDETRYTDWTDVLFGTGVNQNYQLSLSNGNDKLRYHVSAGHTSEKGIVNKAYFQRTNFRANVDNDMFDWLSTSFNVGFAHNKGRSVYESRSSLRAGSILSAINTPPFMQVWSSDDPTIYDEDAYGSRILNPMAANAADMTYQTDRLQGALALDFKPFQGFHYKITYSMDLNNSRDDYYLDPLTTSDGRSTKGYVSESTSRNAEWLLENILSYDRVFAKKHTLSLLAGSSLQKAQYNGNALAGYDLPESYPEIHSVAVANQLDEDATWSSASAWSLASFLGRANYNYDDRYLFSANVRFDGSSKFAKGHRWGCFPSFSAAWRISNEQFMAQTKDVIDDLKIRAGYGLNGNQGGIGNYSYLASMTIRKVPPTADNSYPGIAITPNSASNPELTWEKTTQYNVGLDLSMFESRVTFTTDVYYKKTDDLLLTVTLPDNVNLPGGITRNDGQMENKGAEFVLSTQNLTGEFKWNTDFNLSFNKNKLLKLGLNKVYYYADMYTTGESAIILKEGLPLGSFYGYRSLGVNVDTGDIDYEDISGNGTIGPEDRTVIGCAQPKFIYGFTNDFSWKGLTLSIFFQGSYGNQIFNASRIDTEGMVDFKNQSKAVLRRWMRPGMVTDVPRSGNVENIHNSSRFVEDGSYLRLKTLTLSYTLPKHLLQKTFISGLQVYVTGQNLLTFTKYTGYDPEVNAYGTSSVALGVDYGTYPQSKTIIAGLNISF